MVKFSEMGIASFRCPSSFHLPLHCPLAGYNTSCPCMLSRTLEMTFLVSRLVRVSWVLRMQKHATDAFRQTSCLGKLSAPCIAPPRLFCRSRTAACSSNLHHHALQQLKPLQWTSLALKGVSEGRRQRLVCCKMLFDCPSHGMSYKNRVCLRISYLLYCKTTCILISDRKVTSKLEEDARGLSHKFRRNTLSLAAKKHLKTDEVDLPCLNASDCLLLCA